MRTLTIMSVVLFVLASLCPLVRAADPPERRCSRGSCRPIRSGAPTSRPCWQRNRGARTLAAGSLKSVSRTPCRPWVRRPKAAAFTRSFGGGAFVRKFRDAGRVDIAFVVYPFRANENHGILLVNGEPPIVDVDDITLLPREGMEQDKTYAAIRKSYPRVTMWPGDRYLRQSVVVEALPGGGQSFVVPYTLRNFCHACEVLGSAFFVSISIRRQTVSASVSCAVELPAKKPPKSETRKETEQIRFVVMVEEGKEFTREAAAPTGLPGTSGGRRRHCWTTGSSS